MGLLPYYDLVKMFGNSAGTWRRTLHQLALIGASMIPLTHKLKHLRNSSIAWAVSQNILKTKIIKIGPKFSKFYTKRTFCMEASKLRAAVSAGKVKL